MAPVNDGPASAPAPPASPAPSGAVASVVRLEILVSALIVLSGALYAAKYLHAMATTSLWNDEIYSNVFFSRHGPWRVVTFYETNNHPLLNLLNSLLPGRESLDPLRSRLWSFAATLALLGGTVLAFARRRRYLAAALAFQLLAVHRELLDLLLQARGYALETLAAAVAAFAVQGFLTEPSRRWLAVLSAAVVLGSYAVPSFVAFGGAVFLLLLVLTRRRDVLAAGAASAAGVFLLYAPVLRKLLYETRMYETWFGRNYVGLRAVEETVALFLVPAPLVSSGPSPAVLLTILLVLAVGPALVPGRREERLASLVTGGASLLFVAVCLLQQTPPPRTTVFLAAPLLLAGVAAATRPLLRRPRLSAGLAVGLALFLVPANLRAAREFTFVPMEDYLAPARFLEALMPRSIPVHPVLAPHLVEPSLAGRRLEKKMDAGRFADGALVVQDDAYSIAERFDGTRLAPGAVSVRWAQRRGGFQALWIAPPRESGVEGARVGGRPLDVARLVDRDLGSTERLGEGSEASVQLLLPEGRYLSLFVVAGIDGVRVEPAIPLPEGEGGVVRAGRLTVFPLGGHHVTSLLLRVKGPSPGVALAEVWAFREGS